MTGLFLTFENRMNLNKVPYQVHFNIPRGNLETSIEARLPNKETKIVAMCAGGARSAFAAKTLQEMDYKNVVSMDGGFNQWKDESRKWEIPAVLDQSKRNRYQRHLLLPEVGRSRTAKTSEL